MAAELVHLWLHDECCSKWLGKDATRGVLDVIDLWECPRCGTEWRCSADPAGVRNWTPAVSVLIIPAP